MTGRPLYEYMPALAERLGIRPPPLEAPSPPPPCPSCGGVMGDGDRVTAGCCALCRRLRSRRRLCWCRRPIDSTASPDVIECAEHDGSLPESAQAPSDPLTPGGVFDRLYP